MMNLILITTVFFSLLTVVVAFYLVWLTKHRWAWVLMSVGLLVVSFRRITRVLTEYANVPFFLSPYLTPVSAFIMSIFLFLSMLLIIPIIKSIKNSEARYHSIFDSSGVSLWEETHYDVYILLEELKRSGVTDLREYITEHPEFIGKAIECIKIVDVNKRTLELFKAKDKQIFIKDLGKTFTEQSKQVFIDVLVSAFNGFNIFEAESQYKDLEGNIFNTLIKVVDPEEKKLGENSIVSITDISARVLAEKKLLTVLEEKNTLLKELYHRTKNNMQVIISMLNLRSYTIDNEIVSIAFNDMIGRIQSMSLVHEKLYKSENLSVIKLDDYIEELIPLLISTDSMWDPKIQINLDLDSVLVDIDSAIPCGLIINELISNTYKHAFKNLNSGEVKISLHNLEEDKVEIIVADDGAGLPLGFDIEKCETLGLQTVIALGEDQLHGSVDIVSNTNEKGFAWRLVFTNAPGNSRI